MWLETPVFTIQTFPADRAGVMLLKQKTFIMLPKNQFQINAVNHDNSRNKKHLLIRIECT